MPRLPISKKCGDVRVCDYDNGGFFVDLGRHHRIEAGFRASMTDNDLRLGLYVYICKVANAVDFMASRA